MSDQTARLDLPLLLPAQAQKHVTHNEALQRLDLVVQLAVEGFDATIPPALPGEGRVWALGPAPAADWAGHGGELAAWLGGSWVFVVPGEGWLACDAARRELRLRQGTQWVVQRPPDLDNLPGLGIGTGHDAENRLAVVSAATLLSHAGSDHRLKVNKAAAAQTASLLFQTDWSGRAEMGLAGTDDFSVKVSADGAVWRTGLAIARATGAVQIPGALALTGPLSGTAVAQGATDTTPGRVLTTGYMGLGGNAVNLTEADSLDAVAQTGIYSWSSTSLPANAPGAFFATMLHVRRSASNHTQVVQRIGTTAATNTLFARSSGTTGWGAWRRLDPEYGSNANGEYTRLPDGTQICWRAAGITTNPAEFVGTPVSIDGNKLRIGRWF